MALGTGQTCVRPGQGVVGIDCVIESDGGPVCSGVASGAGSGESNRDVIGVRGCVEVFLVAAIACGGQGGEVVVCVALEALDSGMRASERKDGMIEGRLSPAAGGVAHGAIRGEAA